MLVLHDDISTWKRCVAGEIVADGACDATMTDGQIKLTIVTSGSNTHIVFMQSLGTSGALLPFLKYY